MPAKLALAAALIGLGAACCPIPVPREVSVRPQLTIEVVDATGSPLEGASVEVRRYVANPGPETELQTWSVRSGPRGRVTLAEIVETEATMPLMMHGVLWYGWEACATHPDHALGCTHYDAHQPVEPPQTLRVQMGVGSQLPLYSPPSTD